MPEETKYYLESRHHCEDCDGVGYSGNNIVDSPEGQALLFNISNLYAPGAIRSLVDVWRSSATHTGASSPVQDMARTIFPCSDEDKYMLMLAYFDETGHEDDLNAKIAGVGGLLASEDAWKTFETEWDKALASEDIEYFHMKEFNGLVGPFSKWKNTPEKKEEFYNRLWNIIEAVQPILLGCFVPLDDYRRLLNKEARKSLEDVYFVTYLSCVGGVCEHFFFQTEYTESISMIFDDKKGFKGRAYEYYDRVMELGNGYFDGKIPPPVFRNMRKILPLQAADIIAYECGKEYKRRLYSPQNKPRPGFTRLNAIVEQTECLRGKYEGEDAPPIIFHPVEHIEAIARTFDRQ